MDSYQSILYHSSEYVGCILNTLSHDLQYLEEWSVHNDDKQLDTIIALRKQFEKIGDAVREEVSKYDNDNR